MRFWHFLLCVALLLPVHPTLCCSAARRVTLPIDATRQACRSYPRRRDYSMVITHFLYQLKSVLVFKLLCDVLRVA
jgi:hypothetical protein